MRNLFTRREILKIVTNYSQDWILLSFLWIPLELSYFFSLSLSQSHLLSSSKLLLSPLFLYPSISSAFYFSCIYLFFPKKEGVREGHLRWKKEEEGKEEEGRNTVRCKEPQAGVCSLCYQLYFAVLASSCCLPWGKSFAHVQWRGKLQAILVYVF